MVQANILQFKSKEYIIEIRKYQVKAIIIIPCPETYQQTRYINPMLVQCCSTVYDPKLNNFYENINQSINLFHTMQYIVLVYTENNNI